MEVGGIGLAVGGVALAVDSIGLAFGAVMLAVGLDCKRPTPPWIQGAPYLCSSPESRLSFSIKHH